MLPHMLPSRYRKYIYKCVVFLTSYYMLPVFVKKKILIPFLNNLTVACGNMLILPRNIYATMVK